MKQIILILIFSIATISCGTDELVVNNAPKDNLIGNTNLTDKLKRVSQYPTAVDNIIDNTSCFSIQFPYSVIVNGSAVNISSESDYETVRDIIDNDDNDTDYVTIQFPVTAVYADYSQVNFSNQAQLDSAVSICSPSIELSCMDFVYALEVKTYNSQNQLAETFALNSKKGLYELVEDMGFYDAVAFAYPVVFNTPDGLSLTIEDNTQLEQTIDSYTDDCLALLNPEPGPGPEPGDDFTDILLQGNWYVSYFFRDSDRTDDYTDFDFTFNTNGTVTVTGVGTPGSGTWASYTDSGDLIAEFTFTNNDLEELEEDWTVTEFSTTLIKMQHVSGGGDDIRYLYLSKN